MAKTAQEKATLNGMEATFSRPETEDYEPEFGLTKREYFAGLALQGLVSNQHYAPQADTSYLPKLALGYADALLLELEK